MMSELKKIAYSTNGNETSKKLHVIHHLAPASPEKNEEYEAVQDTPPDSPVKDDKVEVPRKSPPKSPLKSSTTMMYQPRRIRQFWHRINQYYDM
jgi:hypothetical protein